MSNVDVTTFEVVVTTRDVFQVDLDQYLLDLRIDPAELLCETYEAAQSKGREMLARYPLVKRFRINKWTETYEGEVPA